MPTANAQKRINVELMRRMLKFYSGSYYDENEEIVLLSLSGNSCRSSHINPTYFSMKKVQGQRQKERDEEDGENSSQDERRE